MRYNLHTHTHRCRHAQGSDRDYVEAAIAAGIKTLGFSDHCPQFFPGGYYSTFRMFPEEAAEYAESVRSLAREYAADIRILLGFETEYYPELFPELRRLVRQLGCDYLILGQHFIKNEYDYPFFRASEPPRADIDRYLSQVLEGLRTGSFTYIAHPDILGFRGGDEVFYRERMKTFCATLREMDIPILEESEKTFGADSRQAAEDRSVLLADELEILYFDKQARNKEDAETIRDLSADVREDLEARFALTDEELEYFRKKMTENYGYISIRECREFLDKR